MNGGLSLLLPLLLVLVAGGLLLGPMLRVSARADRWDVDQGAERRGTATGWADDGAGNCRSGPSRRHGGAVPFAERPFDWSRDLEVPRWT